MKKMNFTIAKPAFVMLLCGMLGGCFTIKTSDSRRYETHIEPGYYQYSAVRVDAVTPIISADNGLGRRVLRLSASGDFIRHDGGRKIRVDKGVPAVTIGIFPVRGISDTARPQVSLGEVMFHYFTMFTISTFYGIFVEPFRDYHDDIKTEGLAVVGCIKRYVDASNAREVVDNFAETGRSKVAQAELYGYTVDVNGVRYKSDSSGRVYLDQFPAGTLLNIRIVTAPVLRYDSNDSLEDLVGIELKAQCP